MCPICFLDICLSSLRSGLGCGFCTAERTLKARQRLYTPLWVYTSGCRLFVYGKAPEETVVVTTMNLFRMVTYRVKKVIAWILAVGVLILLALGIYFVMGAL